MGISYQAARGMTQPELFPVPLARPARPRLVQLLGGRIVEDRKEGTSYSLEDRFLVPPFSVLDARAGYWRERKAQWLAWGIAGAEGRSTELTYTKSLLKYRPTMENQSSVFDPVLCELIYRWFLPSPAPERGLPARARILDPFAGESTKGLVASRLGHDYVGVELRSEQVEANRRQAELLGVAPEWIVGDSAQLAALAHGWFDLVWTSPPYYDLESYEGGEADRSTCDPWSNSSYAAFMRWLGDILAQAVGLLRYGRFVALKVGDVRHAKSGAYHDFVGDTVRCLRALGLHYWNHAILVTPVGSLPVRTTRPFAANRKLGKTHQDVVIFYKGDPETISDLYPREIDFGEPEPEDEDGLG